MLSQIETLEKEAKIKLPANILDHINGGSGNEHTIRRNCEAFGEIALVPRVLRPMQSISTAIDIFGCKVSSPILIAPTAFHNLVSSEAEIATVKAAEKYGCIMVASMMSSITLEKIASKTTTPLWFQLHIHQDFNLTEQLIRRAEAARYKAIVITVDIPQLGNRRRDIHNDFSLKEKCDPVNFNSPTEKTNGSQFNPLASWNDIKRVKSLTKLPILLKGILHSLDAAQTIDYSIDGIIVSNHGGRQLEESVATIEALPAIADAIAGRIPILIDGGIRSGADIVKAIAMGADAILIGRPILWGLAGDNQQGVEKVISSLHDELTLAMRLTGCATIKDIKNEGNSLVLLRKIYNKGKMHKLQHGTDAIQQQLALVMENQKKLFELLDVKSPPKTSTILSKL